MHGSKPSAAVCFVGYRKKAVPIIGTALVLLFEYCFPVFIIICVKAHFDLLFVILFFGKRRQLVFWVQ